jgi:hypothetical protein
MHEACQTVKVFGAAGFPAVFAGVRAPPRKKRHQSEDDVSSASIVRMTRIADCKIDKTITLAA